MRNVPEEIMAKTVEMFADVKMEAVSVTMCRVPALVREAGRALYVTARVRLESTDQIVRMRAFAKTMETAIQ
jgi:sigma54-dependent transcription regulator